MQSPRETAYNAAMHKTSNKRSLPNPLRMPLLFLAGLVAVCFCQCWLGGTGGIDPAFMVMDSHRGISWPPWHTYWFYVGLMLYPMLLLLAVGLIWGGIRSGAASTEAGLRYAFGSVQPQYHAGAARFLTACARAMAWGGVLLGVAACGLMELCEYLNVHYYEPSFEEEVEAVVSVYEALSYKAERWARFTPLAGLVLGRILFGALADGARIRSDYRAQKLEPDLRAAVDRAMELDPDDPEVLVVAATPLVLAPEGRGRDLDEGERLARQALAAAPGPERARLLLARIAELRDDPEVAAARYRELLEDNSSCRPARTRLADLGAAPPP